MEEQLLVVEKYYLDEINIINSRHDARIKKLDGQMVVSCPTFVYYSKLYISSNTIHQLRICISKSRLQKRASTN